jgi:hypothetical protein
MKRRPERSKKEDTREVRFWTNEEARKASPYIRSVLASLREHWLEMQVQDGRARKLAAKPGRPDRSSIIVQSEAARRCEEARNKFLDAVDELEEIDVFCLDPVHGEAVIPFLNGEQPAWFVFDLFAAEPITQWRYHSDPADTYRPLHELWDKISTVV